MEKTYNPHTIEQEWYNRWEQAGYFKPSNQGSSYCIMLPPPNVTGSLHMGHGFQHSLMDALIRYHRMCGHNTLWQGGVDHAGIATQIVVERQLEAENKSRHTLGRSAFEERIWQWKAESGNNISRQLRRMGSSLDWSRERFTMDANFSKAVQTAFIQLYREGLIYRGKRLVNWDPKLQSAVSDLEVISSEEMGQLWYIRYPLADNSGHLVVATTRPETIFGDVAVAVHPTDDRYQHLIGKQLCLPFTERTIPIIADEGIDPEFGTGCVKITPAHDFNDYAMGQRHQLPQINIFTPTATLNDNTPTAYRGLDRFEARKKVIEELTALGSIEKITPHMLAVPRCERTGQVIEPYLTDQWYVNMKTLAQPAIVAVEKGELRFIPENWTKTYLQWLTNIEDWCISRQLWWGHRIPAWYDESGNIYIGTDEKQIRQEYKLEEAIKLKQDEDVLDTWFSSALWPFATLGWPEKTSELSTFYPTNVLVTGFDIIFFWVARMVMFGLHFTKQVPFKEVYITGLIRDQYGQKMSKSKGNVLDPIDLIDGINLDDLIKKRTYGLLQPAMAKQIADNTRQQFPEGIPAFGTDALRFTFCALANTGRDIRFDLNRVAGYRNFCNKLWNATRFVLMHTETQGETFLTSPRELSIPDQWIYSRLQHIIQEVHSHFSNYRFDLLAQTIYDFVWGDYCDWYVELAKVTLHNEHASEVLKNGTRFTLLDVLENILRLAHPLMPYITEEIWQRIALLLNKHSPSIQLQAYPAVDTTIIYPDAENAVNWLQQIVMAIRNIRSEMQVSPSKKLPLLIRNANQQELQFFNSLELEISQLAKLSSIKEAQKNSPPAATALVGKLELLIPLSDAIDTKAEIARLNKEIEKLNTNLDKAEQKLANEDYIAKAPPLVVSKEKAKAAELRIQCEKLRHQLQQFHLSNG